MDRVYVLVVVTHRFVQNLYISNDLNIVQAASGFFMGDRRFLFLLLHLSHFWPRSWRLSFGCGGRIMRRAHPSPPPLHSFARRR
jgi:hypothetical protein